MHQTNLDLILILFLLIGFAVPSMMTGILILKALKKSFTHFYEQFKCKIATASFLFNLPVMFAIVFGLIKLGYN